MFFTAQWYIVSHSSIKYYSSGFIAKILDSVFQQRKLLNSLHRRSFSSLAKQMEQINITPSCNHDAWHSRGLRENCLSFRESFICTTQRLRQKYLLKKLSNISCWYLYLHSNIIYCNRVNDADRIRWVEILICFVCPTNWATTIFVYYSSE